MISIIVPIYNIEDFLPACIESVLTQTYTDFELLLVNDGSSDNSLNICLQYKEKDERIKVIDKQNGGLSDARNAGINEALGTYIVLLDGDDYLNKGALQALQDSIQEHNHPDIILNRRIDFIMSTQKFVECSYQFDKRELQGKNAHEVFSYCLNLPNYLFGAWSIVAKTDYLKREKLIFPFGLYHEDEEWSPKTILSAKSIGYNNHPLFIYRLDREGSIMATPNIKREYDKIKIIDILFEESQKAKYNSLAQKIFYLRRQQLLFGTIIDFNKYKYHIDAKTLKSHIKSRIYLLKKSPKKNHRLTYYMVKIIGIQNTSKLLAAIKK